VKKKVAKISEIFNIIPREMYALMEGVMRKSVLKLLKYGWPDKIIANYLMIKPSIVRYYRKKYRIHKNEYQGFY